LYNASIKYNIRLSSINSGNKHNAIPREGFAIIFIDNAKSSEFEKYISEFNSIVKSEYSTKEPNLNITFEKLKNNSSVIPFEIQSNLLKSFYAMPHGVIRMSPDIEGLVQTSTNFAIVETKDDGITALTSQRSSVESEKKYIADTVKCVFELGNAEVITGDGYPAWQPNINSSIVKLAKDIYKDLFGKEAKIEAIHAGLECGLIGEKYPGMDMISFGPTLMDVHSPDEKISISTTENCWKLLLGILKNIPEK
jgi:dipeptidase D